MPVHGSFPFLSAILAVAASAVLAVDKASAEVPRRELASEVPVTVAVAGGAETRCRATAWSGEVLTTDRGEFRWEELKSGSVLASLKALVADRDGAAAADACAVVMSLPEPGSAARFAQDWARRQGATAEQLKAAEAEASALKAAREERRRKAADADPSCGEPEAGSFPSTPWTLLPQADFDKAAAETLEEARGLLAKAGASATLHTTTHIALLSESADAAFAKDAAWLETLAGDWDKAFAAVGVTVAPQGRFVVVMMADRDRWRALAASVRAGDTSRIEGATVYPSGRPIVILAPAADPALRRFEAARGLARAMLHSSGSPVRPAPWINEALPVVMADTAVPAARADARLRGDGVRAIRGGVRMGTVLDATYGSKAWTDQRALAEALSYVFARWLYERVGLRVVAYAKDIKPGESEEQRFQRVFGMSRAQAVGQAGKWFSTND